MIVPSIDLQGGQAVQLIGGKQLAIEAGDPMPLAEKFSRVGTIAVIDLDAAMGVGSNAGLIRDLVQQFPCRVGGGIRTVEAARQWLDLGAEQVIIGTAATPEFLSELPRDRVVAAVDARHGKVVVKGWTEATEHSVLDQMRRMNELVSGFLVTVVENEGRLTGIDAEYAKALQMAAGTARVIYAGGVRNAHEIAQLDRIGLDAQVGMALYNGTLDLAEAFTAPLVSDRPDGLWPTVVTNESGTALGLTYSNHQSVRHAVQTGEGAYWSRKRGLWIKGKGSGASQRLVRFDVDCDRDTLRAVVEQRDGFCHTGADTCWGSLEGIEGLAKTLARRLQEAPSGSYTRRLFDDSSLLEKKLLEEAQEVCAASSKEEAAAEVADLLYFALVRLYALDARLPDVERTLSQRSRRVTRRAGDAKP